MSAPTGTAPARVLRATLAVVAPSPRRLALAVAAGSAALGSAVALTAVSAWLISRAAQHPSIVALSVAVVAVRALGISRGVFRYLERLASHDVALRGTVRLREQLYRRLAAADRGVVAGLRRGDLLARVGADVDLVGDVLVRGLLPFAVAVVVCGAGVALMATVLPLAAAVLAACLLLACGLAPWLAGTAAARAHHVADESSAEISALANELLDNATELVVEGRVEQRLDAASRVERRRARALDGAARPGAWSSAVTSASVGIAVVACLAAGVDAVAAGRLAPVLLALVALVPLALLEVVAPLPAAATAVVRARRAAERLVPLLHTPDTGVPDATARSRDDSHEPAPRGGALLSARGVACAWPGSPAALCDVDLDLVRGEVVAVTGPSGSGKSTLLRTLAGLLPAASGRLWVGGVPIADVDPHGLRRQVTLTAEDAHVFTTTLRDNLLVARGDATDGELSSVLGRVGLEPWVRGLQDGLDTVVEPGSISGGERRRLLLARALLVGSDVLLLDEPAEHLDREAADGLMDELRRHARSHGAAVVVVTHHVAAAARADRVLVVHDEQVASSVGVVPA